MKETLPDALERAARFVAAWKRPCALIGGAAMVLRVRARPTLDVDLVVTAEGADVDLVLDRAREVGFTLDSDPQTRSLAEEGLVQLDGPVGRESFGADLIFVDSPFLARVVARATPVSVGTFTLPVATLEDLLLLKLEAGRGIDLDDAIAIKDAFEETLDRAYLAEQADTLGLRGALENLLGSM